MARKILLLGDDPKVHRQAAEALPSPDWELAVEPSTEDGLGRILAGEADLAVIDVDLAGGRGLPAADEVQRRMGPFPLVFLVASERQDLVREAQQRHIAAVTKPIRAEELRNAVALALEPEKIALTPGPVLAAPTFGELRQRPVHLLLGELCRRGSTGLLELRVGGFQAGIYLEHGWVVAANTAPPTSQTYAEVVFRACALSQGTWSFRAGAEKPEALAPARLHPLALADTGVRRAYPPATIRDWLGRHRDERLVAHPELATTLAAAGIVTNLPAELEAATTVAELLGGLSDPDLALAFTLAGFALVRFARATSAAPQASRGTPLTPAERRAIEIERLRIEGVSHYDVLGVGPSTDPAEIRRAYFAAAKRWHTDAFPGRDLGDLASVAEGIFAAISEAYAVLTDPAKRAEYDVFLERKAKGLPTDVAQVLKAEAAFLEAQKLFRAQRFADAEGSFRQAVELNPAEAEFWAYLGASAYRARGSAAAPEAREAFARARALIPDSLVTEYLEAQLEIGEGELDAAESRLRKILLEKPDHREASRDLRALHERKERESATGRGFLRPLWKRK